MPRPRIAAIGLLCTALLAACAPAAPQAVVPTAAPPTAAPTVAPSPTPPPVFAAGSTVGGVDVSGLTLAAAGERLKSDLATLPAVELRAGEAELALEPDVVGLAAPLDRLLDEAGDALASAAPADVPLALTLDEAALRERLDGFAGELGASSGEVTVITSTDVLSRSFAYTPGKALDVDAAVEQVSAGLARGETGPFELELTADEQPPRVPLERLREEVEAMAAEWDGVVGFHLHDLATGEAIGFHDRTVFAGASTVKTAIMLYAYVNLDKFTPAQERALQKMIKESDNLAANDILAAGAGAQGTEYAFIGADEMSTMLQEQLGLRHTYLYVPYETTDYIKLYKPKFRCGPTGAVGEKPYTEMGNCLRAEPASMAQLYVMIDQCANGEGLLLDEFDKLNPKRCQEMLDRLETNEDETRLRAGIPADVRVEHKSGWIEDMQADNGIVRSPNGDYVLSVYIYKPLTGGRYLWADEVMAPVVAAFSRLAYTAYHPVPLEEEQAK